VELFVPVGFYWGSCLYWLGFTAGVVCTCFLLVDLSAPVGTCVFLQVELSVVVHITDRNDNRPVFSQPVYFGHISEGSPDRSPVICE
jgi:hypothetical protein